MHFFRWIKEGKFSSFPEVRIAYKAWNHPEAKSILMGPEPTAAKDAKAVIDYNARIVRGGEEISARVESFVSFLKGLKMEQIQKMTDETIQQLRETLHTLEGMATEAAKRRKKK